MRGKGGIYININIGRRKDYHTELRDTEGEIKAHMKNLKKDILQLFCSAIPAHTTLAEAPIRVPFPPRQAPNASAQTSGLRERHTSGDSASSTITGIWREGRCVKGREGKWTNPALSVGSCPNITKGIKKQGVPSEK